MKSVFQEFIDSFLEFDLTARSNIGYDENQFNQTYKLLESLEPYFRQTNSVPLEVANVFVNLYGAIESSSYRHTEITAEKLKYAADQLASLALKITSTDYK